MTIFRREANSGAYKLSTFFAAKTLVTFPIQVSSHWPSTLVQSYIVSLEASNIKHDSIDTIAFWFQECDIVMDHAMLVWKDACFWFQKLIAEQS